MVDSIGKTGIPVEGLKLIDPSKLKPQKISDIEDGNLKARLEKLAAGADEVIRQKFTTWDLPPDELYAEVKVNGKTVVKITNNGYAQSSNGIGGKLMAAGIFDNEAGEGPRLAQQRAEKIAEYLGGEVVKAPTALSQSEWKQLPEPTEVFDQAGYDAYMAEREKFIEENHRQAEALRNSGWYETLFQTQAIAQDDS